jgi:hypothetical protein
MAPLSRALQDDCLGRFRAGAASRSSFSIVALREPIENMRAVLDRASSAFATRSPDGVANRRSRCFGARCIANVVRFYGRRPLPTVSIARSFTEAMKLRLLFFAAVTFALAGPPFAAAGQSIAPLCNPQVAAAQVVATAARRKAAGAHAKPPLIDSFDWPDGPFGVLESGGRYAFFATDGGNHRNGKAGSMTMTFGSLADPLGSGSGRDAPIDVAIENDLGLNPKHGAYSYLGGGPVYLVPPGLPGAGNLLTVYHAERNTTGTGGFYSLLGLARSTDGGHSWHDLGEIVEANQPYRRDLEGYDIGVSQLVTDPTGTYFYVYFPDWIENGTANPTTVTIMSVARVELRTLLAAAFATQPTALPAFSKRYDGAWRQPGINGRSTDLEPGSTPGDPSVTYSAYLKRYVVVADDTEVISYGESPDGIAWTSRPTLITAPNKVYARAVGIGADPNSLGRQFYIYFTHRVNWTTATVGRFPVTCGAKTVR